VLLGPLKWKLDEVNTQVQTDAGSGIHFATSFAKWAEDTDQNRLHRGSGAGVTQAEAIQVSLFELIERVYFRHFFDRQTGQGRLGRDVAWRSSNGFAAHSSREDAERAAAIELAERDLFIRHWLTRSPLVSHLDQRVTAGLERYETRLARLGSRVLLLDSQQPLQVWVTLGAIRRPGLGWLIATQASPSSEESVLGLRHQLVRWAGWLESNFPEDSGQSLDSRFDWISALPQTPTTAADHALLFLRCGQWSKYPWFWSEDFTQGERGPKISDFTREPARVHFQTQEIQTNLGLPFFVTRAMSKDLAPIWFGGDRAPEALGYLFEAMGIGMVDDLNLNAHPLA
jgi:hypothetical protein